LSPLLALWLVVGCSDPPLDVTLHTGRVRIGGQVRQAVALPPGTSAEDLDPVAVGASCAGSVGGHTVGPAWTPVEGLTAAPAETECGEPVWVEVARARRAGPADGLLVIVDTLRADHVTAERTPALWAHASEAWFPRRAHAPSPWTQPSVAALFTGRPPWAIGGEGARTLPAEQVTLAELLPGRERWMVTANPYTYASRGFGQGFDRVAEVADDAEVLETTLAWLAEPRRGPRFVVVHLVGPHLPYEPEPPPPGATERVGDQFWDLDGAGSYTEEVDRERIRALYAAEVAQVDARVGRLLEAMPGAVTAVVSDHGEELFEHGGFEHGHALWEEVTRVHVALSGEAERPEGLVRLQDLTPRLAAALGAADPGTWAAPGDAVFLAYMLPTRRSHVHREGVIAPEGRLLVGQTSYAEGDVDALRARLAAWREVPWRQERVDRRLCRLEVLAGQTLRVAAGMRSEVPPGAWGPARRVEGELVIEPVRSGTWEVEGVDAGTCSFELSAQPVPFTELEIERLRVLGYVE